MVEGESNEAVGESCERRRRGCQIGLVRVGGRQTRRLLGEGHGTGIVCGLGKRLTDELDDNDTHAETEASSDFIGS